MVFKQPGDVNVRTLYELAGKVVVTFVEDPSETDDTKKWWNFGYTWPKNKSTDQACSVHLIRNLQKGNPAYQDTYNGIQYYGKGGVSLNTKGQKDKILFNQSRQLELMEEQASKYSGNDKLMGMVYITTTGYCENIKDRDKRMWKPKYVQPIFDLWEDQNVRDTTRALMPRGVNTTQGSAAAVIARCRPKMVFIDFVDSRRCAMVYKLNFGGINVQDWTDRDTTKVEDSSVEHNLEERRRELYGQKFRGQQL